MPEATATNRSKGGTVHVTIPASAADNLQMMNKITANLMGKLGCPGCHSGFDIRWIREDLNFKVDLRGEIASIAAH